jgi:hypothetical protein
VPALEETPEKSPTWASAGPYSEILYLAENVLEIQMLKLVLASLSVIKKIFL